MLGQPHLQMHAPPNLVTRCTETSLQTARGWNTFDTTATSSAAEKFKAKKAPPRKEMAHPQRDRPQAPSSQAPPSCTHRNKKPKRGGGSLAFQTNGPPKHRREASLLHQQEGSRSTKQTHLAPYCSRALRSQIALQLLGRPSEKSFKSPIPARSLELKPHLTHLDGTAEGARRAAMACAVVSVTPGHGLSDVPR